MKIAYSLYEMAYFIIIGLYFIICYRSGVYISTSM